ncbi:MAG: DNA polymerase III subunit beta [Parcubacteria group bacterium]|nr:DNA polymerase III subunit beta [Parcubacteria group bacterium]
MPSPSTVTTPPTTKTTNLHIFCIRDNLERALILVQRIVGRHATLPILGNILLEAAQGRLTLLATNLEVGVRYTVGAKVEADGRFTVPARLFTDLTHQFPDERLELIVGDDGLTMRGEHATSTLRGLPAEEFPLIPQPSLGATELTLPRRFFAEGLRQVMFSAAIEETRPELAGVLCSLYQDELSLAATDSYRLTERVMKLGAAPQPTKELRVILPIKSAQEVATLLEGGEENEEVQIALSENQVFFTLPHAQLTSRLIEGTYPDYRKILPTAVGSEFVGKRADFLRAVKTSALFVRATSNDVILALDPEAGTVTVSAESDDKGKSTVTLAGEVKGGRLAIAFNARYLAEGLAAFSGEKIRFTCTTNAAPGLLSDPEQSGYLYLVMPIKRQ